MHTWPILLPLLLSTLTSAGMTLAAWLRPPTRMSRGFVVLMAGTTAWIACWFVGGIVPDVATKFFVANVRIAIASFLPLAVFSLGRAITGEPRLPRALWGVLTLEPLMAVALALSSPFHGWLLRSPQLQPSGLLLTSWGPWFAVHAVYSYSLVLATGLQMGIAAVRASSHARRRLGLMLAAPIPALIGDLVFIMGFSPVPGLSLSPVFASVSAVLFFLIMRRYHFLELAPIARHEVVDMIGEVVFVVDQHGLLADMNHAALRLFGLQGTDQVGRPAAGLFPGIDSLLASEARAGAVLPDMPLTVDGRPLVFETHISPLSADGEPRGRVFLLHDVTASRRQEQAAREHATRLEEVDRLKDGFVATVSHELRTPLGSILGLTDVLLDAPLGPNEARHVRTIQQSGNLLLALVNDILDLSKVKSGTLPVNPVPSYPGALVEEVLESLSPGAEQKGLRLHWHCPPLGPLLFDPVRLRQILLNLVGNALKFTPAGSIAVTVTRDGPLLRMVVTDTGPGVAPDKRAMIFDEFTQVDSGTTRITGGTGLGLPIARRLARLMGGDITMDAAPGGGAAFTVTFRADPLPAPMLSRPAMPGGTALVFAPHPLRLRTLADALHRLGFEVEPYDSWAALMGRRHKLPAPALAWVAAPTLSRAEGEELRGLADATVVELERPTEEFRHALPTAQVVRAPVWSRDVPDLVRSVRPSPSALEAGKEPVDAADSGTRLTRVLLADDVSDNRELADAYLSGQPVRVDYAADGEEAVALLRRGEYDVVFLDLEMPRMDGYAAARAMRRLELEERRAPLPIVAITAHGQPEHIAATAAAGFSHHLVRPLGKKAFLEAVEHFGGAALRRAEADADPAIVKLRDGYHGKLVAQRDWLNERIAEGDVVAVRKFGHQIFGTATSFGFLELGAIGRGLESAAEGAPRLLPELAAAFAQALRRATPRPAGPSPQVLVVDDEPRLRTTLTRILQHEGFTVRTAGNGREALDTIREQGLPDVILLDLRMPVMDGPAFLAARGAVSGLADVPVIIVAGDRVPSEVPVTRSLRKPFAPDELVAAVRGALEKVEPARVAT